MQFFGERERPARGFRPLAENLPSEGSRRDAGCGDRDGRAPQSQAHERLEKIRVFRIWGAHAPSRAGFSAFAEPTH